MADNAKDVRERAEARAEKAQRAAQDAAEAKADRQATARAVDEKTLRLRALRLARDAAAPPPEVKAKPAKAAAKAGAKTAVKSAAKKPAAAAKRTPIGRSG